VDDVPIVYDMAALGVGNGSPAAQAGHRRGAEEAFEPVVEDAHAQPMPD